MDLNYLYLRRQVSLVRAERAACAPSRAVHQDLARRYGALIALARAAIWPDAAQGGRA